MTESIHGDYSELETSGNVIERAGLHLSQLALFGMALLTFVEIVLRTFFGVSLQFADEVGGYLLVALSFLSLAVCQRNEAFHRMEMLQERLSPFARNRLLLMFDAASLVCSLLLAWYLARLTWHSYAIDETAATLLRTPLWIPQIAMPIGMLLLCGAFLRSMLVRIREINNR